MSNKIEESVQQVHEVTVKFVIDADYHPEIVNSLWRNDWQDWLVGVNVGNHITRKPTEEESESMCWET